MTLFGFGQTHPDYSVRVLNEREVRAGAGILLFLGMIAFLTTFHTGDFTLTRLMVVAFGIDFAIRLFVGPAFSPSLVLGRFMVRNQEPELTGAPQKRFAWGLGLGIALVMAVWTIGLNQAGPVAILGCLTCIVLLLLESAFGICVGCLIYNRLWPGVAQLCPGGVCEIRNRAPITLIRPAQLAVLGVFAVALGVAAPRIAALDPPRMPFAAAEGTPDSERCQVPDFARRIGHEQMWLRHNGCL
jgi:hypothetical protein